MGSSSVSPRTDPQQDASPQDKPIPLIYPILVIIGLVLFWSPIACAAVKALVGLLTRFAPH